MRIWSLATALAMYTTGAFAQGSGEANCTGILSLNLINHPNRVNSLKTLLTEESGLLRQFYSLQEREKSDDNKYTMAYEDDGKLKPLSFETVTASKVGDNCFRVDGKLKIDLDEEDVLITRTSGDPLPVTIFVLAGTDSPFAEGYDVRLQDPQAAVPHAFIMDEGLQQMQPNYVSQFPFDDFKISAYVHAEQEKTTIGSQPANNGEIASPGESHWFAIDLDEEPALVALICEGTCTNYEESANETTVGPLQKSPDTEVLSIPPLDNPTLVFRIGGRDEISVSWSEFSARLTASQRESAQTALRLLSSGTNDNRVASMRVLLELLNNTGDLSMIDLNNLRFEGFTAQATFHLDVSEIMSKVVRSVELELSRPLELSEPADIALLAGCNFFVQIYHDTDPVGEAMTVSLEGDGSVYGKLLFELPQKLINRQVDFGDTSLGMKLYTAGASSADNEEGSVEPSCKVAWPNEHHNENLIPLWQEEEMEDYSFNPSTGVARFTNVDVRSALEPVHIVVFNKTGPIDSSDLQTQSELYPNWALPGSRHLMEEALSILVDTAIDRLEGSASQVRISHGISSAQERGFTASAEVSETNITNAVQPFAGGFGVASLSTNLNETQGALGDSSPKFVVLGRTGLGAGSDYCNTGVPDVLRNSSESILVDFVPNSSIDAMQNLTIDSGGLSLDAQEVLSNIDGKLPIAKCPMVSSSELKHWVIFVDERSRRGHRNALENFATFLFGVSQ